MAVAMDGKVVVRGSGSTAVASLLEELTVNFMKGEPNMSVTYSDIGSAEGAPLGPWRVLLVDPLLAELRDYFQNTEESLRGGATFKQSWPPV